MPLPPVIFEDDTMVAFDKPAGMPIVPDRTVPKAESLMPQVRAKFGEAVANVHRVDPETSGLVLCAKTKPALDFLSGQFQSKTVIKKYFALVAVLPAERALKSLAALRDASAALPETFTVDAPLDEDEHQKGRMRVYSGRGGKESVTEFRMLERFGRFAWLECRPITGRSHQVRVHLAAAGAPILNDALYGDPTIELRLSDLKRGYKGRDQEKPLLPRLALHAGELGLRHPTTREAFVLTAPLPREFEVALRHLRKFSPGRR
ncbi:MAG TPA: pseudouridine synthase [Opitutaceae bacterium]|nr:pseudouridine synthase [Opitutaceae bacterium]